MIRRGADKVVTNGVGLLDCRIELLGAVDKVDASLASSRRLELRWILVKDSIVRIDLEHSIMHIVVECTRFLAVNLGVEVVILWRA